MIRALKLEAEAKDVIFRLDYDETQRKGFPPFIFFAWEEHSSEIEKIASDIENGNITLEEGHEKVKGIMKVTMDALIQILFNN